MTEKRNIDLTRKAGILMPLSSLPSFYGVGDLGKEAYTFVTLLKKMGMKIWQFLPLNPLGYGNSPYQAYSSFAMDEMYLSLEILQKEKLLSKDFLAKEKRKFEKLSMHQKKQVNFECVREMKKASVEEASRCFFENLSKVKEKERESFLAFCKEFWVLPYAFFASLKVVQQRKCWLDWEESLQEKLTTLPLEKLRSKEKWEDFEKELSLQMQLFEQKIALEKELKRTLFVQYKLQQQWTALKTYALSKGIAFMGDLPIYVGIDSADVFFERKEFLLDEKGNPTFVAGVPPDYFSPTGQRWGNPLYDWSHMQENGFAFWKKRLGYMQTLFDIVRIDHFRAFDSYWKIEASCPTAEKGTWEIAPGFALFDTLFETFPKLNVVAEDLGDLRPEVLTLRDHYAFTGMRILQFSFDPQGMEADRENLLIYTGTHDNETLKQWYTSFSKEKKKESLNFFKKNQYKRKNIPLSFLAYVLQSRAYLALIPYADLLFLDKEARINFPGKLLEENWAWRVKNFDTLKKKIKNIRKEVKRSCR